MVYKLLQDCFVLYDFRIGFDIFWRCVGTLHMVLFPYLYHVYFCAIMNINLKKTNGIWPIVIKKVIYWLVACTFAFQFKDAFAKDFNPQQFGVASQGGCEMGVHEVCVMLDLHIN
jgi:hypothetical protein